MNRSFTPEEMLTRWEDRRELQNIVGRLTHSYLMMEEPIIYERWWSKREDVCLGVNNGWYSGKAAVKEYYDALDEKIRIASRCIAAEFPEKLGDKTEEELYGVGQLGIRPADTFVLEIAGDGETAKGIWSIHGTVATMTASGPVSVWDWGYLCIDFIKEGDDWKIWHMQDLQDINTPTGGDWTEEPLSFPEESGFVAIKEFKFPEPNVPCVLREAYYVGRPFTESPKLPEPYDTFTDTFSYGM